MRSVHCPGVQLVRQPSRHAGITRSRLACEPQQGQRLMREDNLLCLRKRRFIVTTDKAGGR
jgi:hypothetical protein